MTPVSTLWHLQILDLERDEKLRRAGQIAQALANDPKLAAARVERDAENNRLALLRAELQDKELQAKSLDAKIKELEARLSSGQVSHPKELGSLEKDRQMHLRHRGELDTNLLELMDAIEGAQKKADKKGVALKKTEATHSSDAHQLEHERDVLNQRVSWLDTERAKTRAALDSDALGTYDRLRQSKAGHALARLKNSVCSLCGIQIPSGLVAHVDDGEEWVFCPGCGRILVA